MIYSIQHISDIIHSTRVGHLESNIQFLLTDSRSLCFPEETLFFAIKTSKGDGAKYVPSLISRGVRNFVVSHIDEEWTNAEVNFLVVPDVREALQCLASFHRHRFSIPIVGITGSNGKTIVKEWLFQLLSPRIITRSPRSYNSQIGVPLSLWLIDEKTEMALIEAGISQPHEMESLQEMIAPTTGVFTFLGDAHQENFSSLHDKCLEKLSLFSHCEHVVVGIDNPIVRECLHEVCFGGKLLTWSRTTDGCTLRVTRITKNDSSTQIDYTYKDKTSSFAIPFVSDAAIDNALTCALTALHMGLSTQELRDRMPLLEPVEMRLNVVEGRRSLTIINDTYNSDINSLTIALDFMHRRSDPHQRRRVVILSDILQTGLESQQLYTKVSHLLRANSVDTFIGIGDDLCLCQDLFDTKEKYFFHTVEAFLFSQAFRSLHDEIVLLKGARQFGFERIEELLVEKVHETKLEVNLSAITDNLNFFLSKTAPDVRFVCMIKADAYGMGAVEVAKTLQDQRVDYLAVAVADEGVTLRRHGITQNIMVMNPEMTSFKTLFDYELQPEIYSFRLLDALIANARRAGIKAFPCHIKLDTGMRRLGFSPQDIPQLIHRLKSQSEVAPRSIFTHFVGADSEEFSDFTQHQFEEFTHAADCLQEAFSHKILRHVCNSAAILTHLDYHLDMCRLGIGLYGVNPLDNTTINNVATLRSVILQIRHVPAGESIGYGRHTVLTRDSRIADIPIGYADGLNRHLGNRRAYCLVNGQRADYVGNICMDICMVDVTNIDCHEGDSVEIFGEHLPVTVLSDCLDTIPYEILTSVSTRVRRVYYF